MPDHADKRDRFRGAFLGCALGDAIGRPFEMMSATDGRLGPALDAALARSGTLSYSDDTEMMISVAESLTRVGGVSADDMLSTLARNYDPARGYGHGMKRALQAFERGDRPGSSTWVEGSRGSGGAVRTVAVACAYHDDLALVAALAEEAAGLTHAHPLGRAGAVVHAVAVARMVGSSDARADLGTVVNAMRDHPLVSGTPMGAKLEKVRDLLDTSAEPRAGVEALGNGVVADEAVPLALFSFLRWAPDFEAVVRNTVLCGGDTDTIAATSGALCGALIGESALPTRWLDRLESGPKGTDYLRALADATFALWCKRGRSGR
ncbi:MAG TPA: ADP-ribosylglycohydrolase family protein [Polyangiaceae bacterium]|jgi:poly(ADP-ribose) glycohydrolase ARH3|nr:ADP-ribosylglycohydrolase family protein [Polyangiaceae bacterium]